MKKRRMKKLNNKGYSLVELIIVIGIIVVLTGAAMITLTVMHSAKAREAAITFDSEISELINNSKNIACDANLDDKIDAADKGYSFGLRLHVVNDKCYLQNVLVKDGAYVQDDAYELANNVNKGDGISLSAYVYVKYTDQSGTTITLGDGNDNEVLIYYKKNGTCAAGYGMYEFFKTSGGDQIASMTLNKNGSHKSN